MFGGQAPSKSVTLDWIRHGEPEGGVKYRGSVDDPLSELGWRQMRSSLGHALEGGTRWNTIVTSPMKRCQAFAQEVAEQLQLPMQVQPDLRELCFGELEGMTPKEAWARSPQLLADLWKAPEKHTPPGGEPFTDFTARVNASITRLLPELEGQHVLVVAHGGVIRAMLTCCLGFAPCDTFKIEIPYAGMTRVKAYLHDDRTDFALQFINGFRPTC